MSTPVWRQAYDRIEKAVAPVADSFVRTEEFAQLAKLVTAVNAQVRSQVNGLAARAWHSINLPAGTDVRSLRAQVGALDREVRMLSLELQRERAKTARAQRRDSGD